jgi:hypothetical protein
MLTTLLTIALNGGGAALAAAQFDPDHFNLQQLRHLAIAFAIGAVVAVLNWVRKQPWKAGVVAATDVARSASVLLLVALLAGWTMPGCASAPPKGTYTAAGEHAWTAHQLLRDLTAVSQTAINLNATTGRLHLHDSDTALVRDFTLIAGAGLNAWGSGASTLEAARASADIAQLPAGVASAARAAFDQAVIDHGAGASTLVLVIDSYKAFRAKLSIDASQNPKLSALLAAIDAEISAMPVS